MPQDETPPEPDSKTEWAERRTDWAEDRTVLANERTFAGWMRTALAATAVALGLAALFRQMEPEWLAKAVASIFMAASLLVIWGAERAAARTIRRMDEHDVRSQSGRRLRIVAIVMSVGVVATGAILWML